MGIRYICYRVFYPLILLIILLILSIPNLNAQNYYADITITVDSSGFVTIEGLTNYPNLTVKNTENYSSKQQSLWLVNITKPEIFSEFVYTFILPKGSSINYIKSSGFIRIEENLGNLMVSGYGENESLSLLIQYKIEKNKDFLQENMVYLFLLPMIIIVSILLLFLIYKEKKTRCSETKENTGEPLKDWKGLNHRQKQIMQLLQERNTPLTQTDIQRELQIPKASVSRNIHGLERKGLIEKEQIGMSNLVRLKKI